MTKLEHLRQTKRFLKKVVKYRKFLQGKGKSYLSSDFVKTETANIDYALPKLVSYDAVQKYLERKETVIRYLIPSNKKEWYNELRKLRETQLN